MDLVWEGKNDLLTQFHDACSTRRAKAMSILVELKLMRLETVLGHLVGLEGGEVHPFRATNLLPIFT